MEVDQGESTSLNIDQGSNLIESLLGEDGLIGEPKAKAEEEEETEEVEASEVEESEPEESEEDAEEATDDTREITTLEELTQALEKSTEELDGLKVTIKAHGQTEQVTLADLKASYQKDSDYRQKTQELAEQRRGFESQAAQARQNIEAQLQQSAQVFNALEQMVITPLDPAEMAQLRQTNPAEYAARLQDYQGKAQYVQNLRQSAAQAYEQNRHALEAQVNAHRAEVLQREREKLEAIPGWGDELKGNILNYLANSYGYTEQELGSVYDHRLVDIVRKAHLFDKMQSDMNVAKKKVEKAPVFVKPGKPAPKASIKHSALQQAKARLAKTGSRHDAARLIESLL